MLSGFSARIAPRLPVSATQRRQFLTMLFGLKRFLERSTTEAHRTSAFWQAAALGTGHTTLVVSHTHAESSEI